MTDDDCWDERERRRGDNLNDIADFPSVLNPTKRVECLRGEGRIRDVWNPPSCRNFNRKLRSRVRRLEPSSRPPAYYTLFRFLNQPASLVSFGIETDLETLDDDFGSSVGEMTISFSSLSRSEEEANFLSLVMFGWTRRAGGGRGGLPECGTWFPELS